MPKKAVKAVRPKCAACKFMQRGTDHADDTRCYRYPPVVLPNGGTTYPRVRADDGVVDVKVPDGEPEKKVAVLAFWCGEFKPL